MSLSLLFGIAAVKAIFSSKHNEQDELDNKIRLEGINTVPIKDVAKVVGVSHRHIVLEQFDANDCRRMLDYAKKIASTRSYKKFEDRLNKELNRQQQQKSNKIKERAAFAKQHIDKRMKEGISDQTIIIKITRPRLINEKIYDKMMYDLHHNTWWGECIVDETIKSQIEIYKMRIPNWVFKTWGMEPDFDLNSNWWLKKRVIKTMEHQYKNCLKQCGHDPLF